MLGADLLSYVANQTCWKRFDFACVPVCSDMMGRESACNLLCFMVLYLCDTILYTQPIGYIGIGVPFIFLLVGKLCRNN